MGGWVGGKTYPAAVRAVARVEKEPAATAVSTMSCGEVGGWVSEWVGGLGESRWVRKARSYSVRVKRSGGTGWVGGWVGRER